MEDALGVDKSADLEIAAKNTVFAGVKRVKSFFSRNDNSYSLSPEVEKNTAANAVTEKKGRKSFIQLKTMADVAEFKDLNLKQIDDKKEDESNEESVSQV